MARSKYIVKKNRSPYTERQEEFESMPRHPPPYTIINPQRFVISPDDATMTKQNDMNHIKDEEQNNSLMVAIENDCARYPKCKCFVYLRNGIVIFLLCFIIVSLVFPYPLHASCIVKWKFGESCTYTIQKFRSQILNWSSCINCGPRGSRCLYTLEEPKIYEDNVIRAIHLGPNLKVMELIRIDFEQINKTCVATGESISNEWFKVFDYGTNYCNLHNLVTGIGFDKSLKFLELTTNAVCTQYNMAVCD